MSNPSQYASDDIRKAFSESSASLLYKDRQKDKDAYGVMESKMVRGEQTRDAIEDKELITNPQHDLFLKSSVARSIERVKDSQNILQLLPDIKQSLEIIIGTILSPKDMMRPTLTFKSNNKVFDNKATPLLNYLKDYFISSYKLDDQLSDMLWDILGKTGSYPIAVLPETAVDYMINSNSRVTMEDLQLTAFQSDGKLPSLGYLADRASNDVVSTENNFNILDFMKSVSLESHQTDRSFDGTIGDKSLNIEVLDNFDMLKMPLLKNKISRQASHAIIENRRATINNDSLKSHRQYSSEDLVVDTSDYTRTQKNKEELTKLYPDRQFVSTPIMRVKTRDGLSKDTIGHPLVLKLPTESVIPVYNPMDPKHHIGYYVMIDPSGNAVRMSDIDNMYKMLQTSSNAASNSGVLSFLLQQSTNAITPAGFDMHQMSMVEGLNRATPIFNQMVERELLDRISRGTYGAGLAMSNTEVPMLIMLSRALTNKRTQLLFVPAEIMSYLAVDYDDFGLGKTLLDDSKMLAALRSMNMVVNSIASTKNAITKRTLNVELDPAEKNPQKAVQMIIQEYVKGTQPEYPLTNNPVDQINYLQLSGVDVSVGEHPRLPSTKFGVEYHDNNYKPIDTAYDEFLKKLHTQATGLSPEVVEGAGSADFATQTILANVLTARRIDLLSRKFTTSLSGFIRTYTYNSQILMDGLAELIESNKIRLKDQHNNTLTSKEVAVYFIESVSVSLPKPDNTQVKQQKEAFDEQAALYDEALKYFFDSEFLNEADLGRLGDSATIESTRNFMKAYFMRNWMKENGVLPELFDIIGNDRDGKPLIDFNEVRDEYMESLALSLMPMMKNAMKRSGTINAKLEKYEDGLANPPGESSGGGSSSGFDYEETSTDTASSSFDDELSGMDEFTETETTETEETSTEEGEGENPDTTNDDGEKPDETDTTP